MPGFTLGDGAGLGVGFGVKGFCGGGAGVVWAGVGVGSIGGARFGFLGFF